MQQISATVVALIGPQAAAVATSAGAAANVTAVVADEAPPLERARRAWRDAVRSSRTYIVHDADPLAAVADAWVALFDGLAGRDDLALAVTEVIAGWRARAVELPDYYLVLDAEDLPATRRHWYLGVLRRAAPARVVPVQQRQVPRVLGSLRSGRWWPDLPTLLEGIEEVAPDALQEGEEGSAIVRPQRQVSAARGDRRRGG